MLTHRLFWLAESAPLRDFLRVALGVDVGGPVCAVVSERGSSMLMQSVRILGVVAYSSQVLCKGWVKVLNPEDQYWYFVI